MASVVNILRAKPLTRAAFAPFGDVIDTRDAQHYSINEGWAERYHDLAALDLTANGGRPAISIFRAAPRPLPLKLEVMERHCLGSQAFVPLGSIVFLVVVAAPGDAPTSVDDLSAFISDGIQGVNYHPGVWHHPLLAIRQENDFLVIDRIAGDADCDEIGINDWNIQLDW